MVRGRPKVDDSDIEDITVTEGTNPMIELQRSTARRMIGRHIQVACVDGRVVDGHLDWCSDYEVAVADSDNRCVIPLDHIVGMVRRAG